MRKLRFLFVFVICLFLNFSLVKALDIYGVNYSKSDVKVLERTEASYGPSNPLVYAGPGALTKENLFLSINKKIYGHGI